MEAITIVLNDLGITEKDAVRNYVLLNASQKVAEFEQECEVFKHKYKQSFQQFEKQLKSSSEENFEKEDDYLGWKFADEGLVYWRTKIDQLKNG